MKGWDQLPDSRGQAARDGSPVHVYPVNDSREHQLWRFCPCRPTVERFDQGSDLITHHAWDGREFYEEEKWTNS